MSELIWVCGRCGNPLPREDFNRYSTNYGGSIGGCRRCTTGWLTLEERVSKLEYALACLEKT